MQVSNVTTYTRGRPSSRLFAAGMLSMMVALLLALFWHPTSSQGQSPSLRGVVLLTTESCPAGYTATKFESPTGTHTQGPITLTITRTDGGEPMEASFTTSGGTLVYVVYVKGGTDFRTYDYRPGGVTSGSGLVSPVNPNNGKTYAISHVTFCYAQPVVPTSTEVVPTNTEVVPTNTEVVPTNTEVVPTNTEVVPTSTEVESTVVVRTPTATDVGPTPTIGDHPVPNCPEGYLQIKFEDPTGTQTQGPITLTVTRSEDGESLEVSFTAADGTIVYIVYVKGGPGYRTYDYRPGGVTSGSGLVAPINPNNGKTYGISHVTFCYLSGATPTPTEASPTSTPSDTPTPTEASPTSTPSDTPTPTEASPTSTPSDTPTPTEAGPTSTPSDTPTPVVPTITAVEGTVVVRTRTATDVVPTNTVVVPTTTVVEGTVVVRTETAVPTSTEGGSAATPTATPVVLPESGVRTTVPGGDNVVAPVATPVVLAGGGNRPATMPVTAGEEPLLMLKLLLSLAFGFMGLGLCFRGFDLRSQSL